MGTIQEVFLPGVVQIGQWLYDHQKDKNTNEIYLNEFLLLDLQLIFASILASNKADFPYLIIDHIITTAIVGRFQPVGYNLECEIPKKYSCNV